MIENLPGCAEANRLGYSLHHYAGNGQSASYVKDGIFLEVYNDGDTAKLTVAIGLISLSTGDFQFPHPRFDIFEKVMIRSYTAIQNSM